MDDSSWWEYKPPQEFQFDKVTQHRHNLSHSEKLNVAIYEKEKTLTDYKRLLTQKKDDLATANLMIKKKDKLLYDCKI